jgi:hypothetical protein
MKKFLTGIAICIFTVCLAQKTEAQGPCYATGGEIVMNGEVWFICPMGGGTTACAYPCRRQ